jgi:tetratricopeptide (TPR) repeat protein
VPSLALLKSKDLDWVQQRLQWRQYATDETILRRGVHSDFLGIIEAGQVNIIFQTPGRRRRTVTLQPGDFFTLHNDMPSSATIRAVTPVALWTLSPTDATGLGQRLPSTLQFSTARLPKLWFPTTWLTIPFNMLRQRPHLAKFGLAVVAILLIWVAIASPQGQNLLTDLHYARGCQYLEQGRTDAALREFETTLEMNPAHAASHNALGYIYYQQGQLKAAAIAFEQASRVAPNSDVIQNNLGLVRNHQGETSQAAENLQRAADLNNNIHQVYVNLGNLCLTHGDWLNAGRAYREALRLNPTLTVTHYNLGVAYYRLQQWDDAHNEFDQALLLDPNMESAYLGLGILAFEQGQFDRAQTAFQHTVKLDTRDAVAFYYLGLIYKLSNQQEQAVEAFERSLGLTDDPVIREQAEWQLKELWQSP